MKTSKPKARRMWANYYDLPILYSDKESARFCSSGIGIQHPVVPVALIPLDAIQPMIDKATEAFVQRIDSDGHYDEAMRAALTAIGMLPRAKKGRK